MRQIYGIYFDGLRSKPINVIVSLSQSTLKISATDEGVFIQQSWERDLIKNIDFSSSKGLQLQYGDNVRQTLIIEGEDEYNYIRERFPEITRQNIYNRLLKNNLFKTLVFSIVVLFGVAFLYLNFIAPYVSQKVVNLVPIEQEIYLGNKMYASIEPYLDINKEKSEELTGFYQSLGLSSNYPIEILYSNSNEVNAFAVPGGKIVVHKGLIDKLDSWEQLAALISHELAHVEKRHSLKTLSRNLSTYFVISVITTDVSGISSVFVENAFKLKELSNSRSFEEEADAVGCQNLIDHQINPEGMTGLFNVLQDSEMDIDNKNAKKVMRVIRTHPLTEDRIINMKKIIDDAKGIIYLDNPQAKKLFNQLTE